MMTVRFGTLEFEVTTSGRTASVTVRQLVRGERVSVASHAETTDAKAALKSMLAFISKSQSRY